MTLSAAVDDEHLLVADHRRGVDRRRCPRSRTATRACRSRGPTRSRRPTTRLNVPIARPPPIASAAADWLSTPSGTGSATHCGAPLLERGDVALMADEEVAAVGRDRGERRAGLRRDAGRHRVAPAHRAGRARRAPSTLPSICTAVTVSPAAATPPRTGLSVGARHAHRAGREIERDDAARVAVAEIGHRDVDRAVRDRRRRRAATWPPTVCVHRVTSGGASSCARAPACAGPPPSCAQSLPAPGAPRGAQMSIVAVVVARAPLALVASIVTRVRARGERRQRRAPRPAARPAQRDRRRAVDPRGHHAGAPASSSAAAIRSPPRTH